MAMFRSAIGTALSRAQPAASRLFSSVARRGPGCGDAASALRRVTRRMVSSYGRVGNVGGMSSKAFWNQDSTWKRPHVLFAGISLFAMAVVDNNIRASLERKWQRRIRDVEMRTSMMYKEKADETDISFL